MLRLRSFALGLMWAASVGCGNQNSSTGDFGPIIQQIDTFGEFTSTRCFKNKAASEGIGQLIYTMATLVLNQDQSGETRFHLYSDSDCQVELASGVQPITYQIVADYDKVSVLHVHQHDVDDSDNDFIFYLPISFTTDGAYVHIDGELSDSGPYVSQPSESELAAFIHDVENVGVFFSGLR